MNTSWKFVWLSLLVYLTFLIGVYLFFLPSFELLTLSESASKERLRYLKLFLPLWLFLPPSLPTKGWLISSGAESPFYHLAPFEIGYNDWGSILRLPIALRAISALFLCMCAQAFEEVIANKIGMKKMFSFQLKMCGISISLVVIFRHLMYLSANKSTLQGNTSSKTDLICS